jgi:iron complex outermembrane recepter protein
MRLLPLLRRISARKRCTTTSKAAANELPTDSFTLVDVDASYRVPMGPASVFLFLRGSSLLDEDARQHASPLKDIAPLPGRSAHFGVRAEF